MYDLKISDVGATSRSNKMHLHKYSRNKMLRNLFYICKPLYFCSENENDGRP